VQDDCLTTAPAMDQLATGELLVIDKPHLGTTEARACHDGTVPYGTMCHSARNQVSRVHSPVSASDKSHKGRLLWDVPAVQHTPQAHARDCSAAADVTPFLLIFHHDPERILHPEVCVAVSCDTTYSNCQAAALQAAL
jgi:hypothetical protein